MLFRSSTAALTSASSAGAGGRMGASSRGSTRRGFWTSSSGAVPWRSSATRWPGTTCSPSCASCPGYVSKHQFSLNQFEIEIAVLNQFEIETLDLNLALCFDGYRNISFSIRLFYLQVEYPKDISEAKDPEFRTLYYESHNFTISIYWSPFLVKANQSGSDHGSGRLWNLYLDEPDDA